MKTIYRVFLCVAILLLTCQTFATSKDFKEYQLTKTTKVKWPTKWNTFLNFMPNISGFQLIGTDDQFDGMILALTSRLEKKKRTLQTVKLEWLDVIKSNSEGIAKNIDHGCSSMGKGFQCSRIAMHKGNNKISGEKMFWNKNSDLIAIKINMKGNTEKINKALTQIEIMDSSK